MKKTWLLALIAVACVATLGKGLARAEGIKIGYVDMQRALNDTDDGKRAKARLKGIFDRKQKELDQRQSELKKMKDDLDKQRASGLLTPQKVAEKEREMQEKFVALQKLYLDHQKALSEEEGKLTRDIFRRMQTIIASIAQAEGFSFIFEKSEASLLWARSEFDLTGQVVRRYNSGEGKGAKKK
jgi:outer membrane protein